MSSLSDIKPGRFIAIDNEPYQVVFYQHIKQARGGAVVKTKLKNLVTGNTLERSFSGADSVEMADLGHIQANFLYNQGEEYFFMDGNTFEQFQFSAKTLGDIVTYLTEGQVVDVLLFNEKPVSVTLPTKIILTVDSAPDGVKGNSAGAATKTVTLSNGLEIRTPLFIKSGDKVVVNTETREYVERAN
ncbi:MAG: elongation factor P [Parcubacteria group bacterium]|nr:MAG: elongation factor P [Parcubacteria group bacterium]